MCQSHRPRIAQAPALKIASVPPQWLRAGRQAKQPGATNRGGCARCGQAPYASSSDGVIHPIIVTSTKNRSLQT